MWRRKADKAREAKGRGEKGEEKRGCEGEDKVDIFSGRKKLYHGEIVEKKWGKCNVVKENMSIFLSFPLFFLLLFSLFPSLLLQREYLLYFGQPCVCLRCRVRRMGSLSLSLSLSRFFLSFFILFLFVSWI